MSFCNLASTTLTDGTGGGVWSSVNTTVGTIGSSSGTVTGLSVGTSLISYTIGSCVANAVVTVNTQPGAINGALSICDLSGTTLTDGTGGGTWTSVNTTVGTIGSSSGTVAGLNVGTTLISYTIGSCVSTAVETVNVQPGAINGVLSICDLSGTTLTDGTGAGVWTSVNTSVATIGSSSGTVAGLNVGTSLISYTIGSCVANAVVTVNVQPTAINGALSICDLSGTTLTDATGGGAWTSVNTTVGTIGSSSGTVSGLTVGTTLISYTIGSCVATAVETVNTQPGSINGVMNFCNLSSTTLTDAAGGGVWTSVNTAVGTIGSSSGTVTGLSVGTTMISYTLGGCYATTVVTVSTQPGAVNGALSFCNLSSTTLTDAVGGGIWSSVNTAVGTIGSSSGTITGLTTGTTLVSYTLGSCFVTTVVTVNIQPGAINGVMSFCDLSGTTLTDADGGGTWTSVNTAVGTIGSSSGTVAGLNVGTSTISYTIGSCAATTIVTVNVQPTAINGTLSICDLSGTTLTDATGGGAWTSVNTTVGTIGSSSGTIAGLNVGTTLISYTIGSCVANAVVTVNTQPGAINGVMSFCDLSATTLTDAAGGGVWTSVNTTVGTIGSSSGTVSGLNVGTTTISYSIGSCYASAVVTVNTQPGAINGVLSFCDLSATTLTDGTSGGVWTSVNTAVGTVGSSSGTVSGLTVGTSVISYTLGGCFATATVTVNTQPVAITGALSICDLSGTTLTDGTGGGIWSSVNTTVATIGSSSGTVAGLNVGTTLISYTIGICVSTAIETVNVQPGAINGVMSFCNLSAVTLTDGTGGGVWTSSNTTVGTVGSTSGTVSGLNVGTTMITYTIGSCFTTAVVTVNTQPVAITGSTALCNFGTTSLTDATPGGTWTSISTGVATIGSTGLVTGASLGTSLISYTIGSCVANVVVTVVTQPAAISGPSSICDLSSVSLSDAVGGGAWSSSNPAVGTIGSLSGIVTALSLGTSTITYTIGSCYITTDITVNIQPAVITGIASVCNLSTTGLTDGTAGGAWSSVSPVIGTVDGFGNVTGIAPGTTTISYTIGSCAATDVVTVNIQPGAINGVASVCVLSATSLTDAAVGGTWSSSSPGVGTVDGSGNVTGVLAGTTVITYTIGNCISTQVVTVNPLPAAITGTMAVCSGLSTQLSDITGGGTWSSSASGTASVGSTGIVTGGVIGSTAATVTISYVLVATGCIMTTPVTVNPLPSLITGSTQVCVNSSITISDVTPGGTWSSNATGIATISSAGLVTGVSAGAVIDTYTLPTGCITTTTITVNPLPVPVSGTLTVCVGLTTNLTDASGVGTWSSSNIHISTGTGGAVTGLSSGTGTVDYILPTSCAITAVVTVNPLPSAIVGTLSVCTGATTALTDAGGGTWSTTSGVASVGSASGIVTGGVVAVPTTATITYTLPTTCIITAVITVNPLPTPILGTLAVCSGLSTTLTDATPGGTWSSTSGVIASVGSSTGVITAGSVLTPTTGTVSYTLLSTGCIITAPVTVNPLPVAISGPMSVCLGYSTTLTDATTPGTWSSASGNVSVGSATGQVTGLAYGTAVVTYTIPTGCINTAVVTVNTVPAAISGTLSVCSGLTTTLSDTPGGGTWSSSPGSGTASVVFNTGVVTGGVAGTAHITYTIGTGCNISAIVTVNPLPNPILGTLTVCAGLTTSLSDGTPGGTWSSSSASLANIGSTTGLVTAGTVFTPTTVTITYTLLSTGCINTAVLTVNPLPTGILGTTAVCSGSATTLSDVATPGVWTSSNSAVASVGSATGIVTGGVVGISTTATITYTVPTSCFITTVVTVNPLPGNILGSLSLCNGVTSTLTDAATPGTWSSSQPSVASIVSGTGVITANAVGTAVITYTLPTGCFVTGVVTVNPLPGVITGPGAVCQASAITLSDASVPGTWSSSNTSVASVSSSGVVTGTATGSTALTATITYTLPTGCITTAIITVNPLPALITGTLNVCSGLTTMLSDATIPGTWSSSNTAVATVGSAGLVTAVGASGTSVITYQLPTGCFVVTVVNVEPLPAAIAGTLVVCSGLTTPLSDATGTGTWSSSATAIATVGSSSGIVTGGPVSVTSTATITYTLATGCISTATVTVNPNPVNIMGSNGVCYGTTITLSDATPSGTWSSSNGNATVGSTGIVTGSNLGTSTITYELATGCLNTVVITVNPLPAVITGTMNVCANFTTVLSDATAGGTWSTSNSSIGTAGSVSGGITGVAAGTVIVTYTLPTGCISTVIVTVNPQPGPIMGATSICQNSTSDLTDSPAGGTWSSSNSILAPVGSTGIVTGGLVGTATITYSLAAGCSSTIVVTVQPLPTIFNVTGGGSYCQGGSGVLIGLSGSNVGVSYLLYYGPSVTGYLAGTGSSLNFGLLTVGGTYTVRATDNTTGCSTDMFGNAVVVVTPTVNPTVSIVTTVGDTVCPGTVVTFYPSSVDSGSAPTYKWSVNGVLVSLGHAYTFIPADGDVISVVMTSNYPCVMPATATGTLKMRVLPDGKPYVSIAIDPGDTICQYALATFTATPTFGGPSPIYKWYVNGVLKDSVGAEFSYYPATGDIVYCVMTSDYLCRTADSTTSNVAVMTVAPMVVPHVDIVPKPNFFVLAGQNDTLTTIVTNAGPDPTYQWEINGTPVFGATSATFISQFHDYDSVTCIVTSSGYCEGISTFDWVYVTVIPLSVQQSAAGTVDVRLIPNPNNGTFIIRGNTGVTGIDEEVSLEITDMMGQVVYRNNVMVKDGKINEQVKLTNTLSNGMYLLNLHSGNDNKVFHFVIEQ